MYRRVLFIMIATFLLMSGCANIYGNDNNNELKTAAQHLNQNGAVFESNLPEQTAEQLFMRMSDFFENMDELMLMMALSKFSEFAIALEPERHSVIYALQRYDVLFEPGYLRDSFTKYGISIRSIHSVTLMYDEFVTENFVPFENDYVNFRWTRHVPPENAVDDLLGRGAVAEHILEHNGITYAVLEWEDYRSNDRVVYHVGWSQHGQAFMVSLGGTFTLDEILAFSYARPIDTWQFRGDAISVSVQGMENVRIFENPNGIAMFGGVGNEIVAVGNGLYRVGAVGFSDVDIERVGYRWLIDEDVQRYQYVLQPGVYEFHADGFIGQPQLLVQHFAEGDRVAVTDFSANLAGLPTAGFELTVTPNPEDNDLVIPD
jgi:outer membrane murein-binding lipoprotein Lpp